MLGVGEIGWLMCAYVCCIVTYRAGLGSPFKGYRSITPNSSKNHRLVCAPKPQLYIANADQPASFYDAAASSAVQAAFRLVEGKREGSLHNHTAPTHACMILNPGSCKTHKMHTRD